MERLGPAAGGPECGLDRSSISLFFGNRAQWRHCPLEGGSKTLETAPLWTNLLIILISAILLALAAKVVVDSAAALGKRLGISGFVVGLTVVAAGTSAPEFGVTLVAALEGRNEISVGNIVGSNIFNLGFALGGAAVLGSLRTNRKLVWRDALALVGSSLLLFALVGFDLTLDHGDGWVLSAFLAGYLWLIWHQRRDESHPPPPREIPESRPAIPYRLVGRLLLGLAAVAMASHILVQAASLVARDLEMSEWVIAVTIVAAGTSLPEVATTLAGVIRKHHSVGIGNIIGSDLFNLLGVLGLAGILETMEVIPSARGSLLALAGMTVLTLLLMRSGWRLSRAEGLLLVAIGVLRWSLDVSHGFPG
jgi:cation:H+ antiporter